MSQETAIEWTDATWNPVTGCTHVSEGCRNCYAETLSLRRGWSAKPWTKQNEAENVRLHPERLDWPLRRQKPMRIFVNSMSDLFHELIPDAYIDRVFAVMALTARHTYQVLTKRPDRMRRYMDGLADRGGSGRGFARLEAAGRALGWTMVFEGRPLLSWPIPNVWLGVSCEDQRNADERIPLLLATPAKVRFLSCEPLLGPIAFPVPCIGSAFWSGLHWVIVGGESGHGCRSMDGEWARSLRDQCTTAGVPFLFKQWGGRTPKAGGRELDGRTWDEYPGVA